MEDAHGQRRRLAKKPRLPGAMYWLLPVMLLAALTLMIINMPERGADPAETEIEARLRAVLGAVAGAGEVRVMVNSAENTVSGVLVVAEGADDVKVRLTLYEAVSTLLNVEVDKIEVVRMKGEDRK